jgi:hypothetical protein
MRSTGAIVMSAFAALWGFLALHLSGQVVWMQAVPIAVSGVLILAALATGRHAVPPAPEERRRIGRAVMLWSAVEGVVIFGGVNVLRNTGHTDWTTAFIAVVVGLHFFPLARSLRVPLYWLTGLGLIGVAAAGLVLVPSGVAQDAAIGLGCAVVLWLTAFVVTAFTPRTTVAAA